MLITVATPFCRLRRQWLTKNPICPFDVCCKFGLSRRNLPFGENKLEREEPPNHFCSWAGSPQWFDYDRGVEEFCIASSCRHAPHRRRNHSRKCSGYY